MEKEVFLKNLKKALSWTFTEKEIKDILMDYEGFFASGEAEGKSEVQILKELGNPKDIALELAEALEKERTSPLWLKIFIRMIITVVVGIAGYWVGTYPLFWLTDVLHDNSLLYIGSSLLYAVLLVVLWLVLIGFTFKMPPVACALTGAWKVALSVCHFAIIFMVIIDYLILDDLFARYLTGQYTVYSFFYEQFFMTLFAFLPLLFAVIAVFGFYRASPVYFTVVSHALGAGAYKWTQFNVLSDLSTPADLAKLPLTLIVYGVSMMVSVLLWLYIRRLRGRCEGNH
jgi:uncharacterized membrane protein